MPGSICKKYRDQDVVFLLLLSHPFFPPYLTENIYMGVTQILFFLFGQWTDAAVGALSLEEAFPHS